MTTTASTPRLLIIVGPTAVGKSAVAVRVAERVGREIVSADSMQIYRQMDIGTAKPSAEERARVRHHLIDIIEPDVPYSVAQYQADADRAIAEVRARGRVPMLVGGTGLYVQAVWDGLDFPIAGPDREFRAAMQAEAQRLGTAALHARLAEIDPAAAARIHPNDQKRIIRALEVHHLTGQPISRFHRRREGPRYHALAFGLKMPRRELNQRIDARIDDMMSAGLLDEVRGLLDRGYHEGLISMKALGYQQLAEHLRGRCELSAAVERFKTATHQFAKRQMTWFRRDRRIRWIDLEPPIDADNVAAEIAAEWEAFD
jgi:tRNA dimethylallyltransferase